MELQKELTWSMHCASGHIVIRERPYHEAVLITNKRVIASSSLSGSELVDFWIGKKPLSRGSSFLLVIDSPFVRTRYELWMSWAHQHHCLFDQLTLEQCSKVVPFMLIENRECRVLVLPSQYQAIEIWPPQE